MKLSHQKIFLIEHALNIDLFDITNNRNLIHVSIRYYSSKLEIMILTI